MNKTEKLKSQFLNLQEQQHQKMLRLKKMQQSTKQNSKATPDDKLYGVSDELNLDTGDVSINSTVGLNNTLEDANTEMRGEIRELKDETGRLRKVLAEKDYEIKRLNRKNLKAEEEKRLLSEAGVASESASTKIVDLSKKNRDLTAQMEVERSKGYRLQQKVNELERNLGNLDLSKAMEQKSPRRNLALSHDESVLSRDDLQEQLSNVNLKMLDYRNQVQSLKQELKVAHKVLSLELGESQINLQSLLSQGGQGFRGRNQQVLALQSKVKELEGKLDGESPKMDKNMSRIKNMEKMRKDQIEALKENLVKSNENTVELQRKFDASKARSKVLSTEIKSLKSQISVLTDKGSHDNELISTLMKQQESLQKMIERNSLKQTSTSKSEIMLTKELHNLKQQESSDLHNLKELLKERDGRVRELESKLECSLSTRDSLDAEDEHKPLRVFSNYDSVQENTANDLKSQNVGHGNNSELQQLSQMSESQQQEINVLYQRLKEYEALYKASEIERIKLGEMIALLNARLQSASHATENAITEQFEEKRKCANLEQQLEVLRAKTDGPLTSRDSARNEDFQEQLLIQRDENHALKEALESTLKAKQDDVTMYQEMMEQTRNVFLEALRSFNSASQ